MRAITLVCAAIALPRTVAAGAPIHFEPGQPEALPNVKAKAMVATFVDREGTGLGDEMATILGGELLDAVSDVGGAGVIVATNRERSGLSSRLGTNYHRAATEIAREQKTMLAAWGILEDAGPNLRVESYVSQVPNSEVGSIRMQLEWGGKAIPGFSADISSRSFHFAPRYVERKGLFRRPLVILNGTRTLKKDRSAASASLRELTAGTHVVADTLIGAWWHVAGKGFEGWMEDHPNIVRIPPQRVEGRGHPCPVYSAPGGLKRGSRVLAGHYDVTDIAYTSKGKWYEIKVLPFGETSNGAPAPVWVPASSVRAIYTLPFVHFVAGLYRYRLGRFAAAAEDYATCLSQADQEDNVTLSAMHQLRGLSQCRAQPDDSEAIRSFDRAVELTPFDARVRSMRALATIVVRSEVVKPSLDDIGAALKLDPGDRVARSLVFGMKGMLAHPAQLGGFGPIGSSVDQHRGDVALLYESAAALRDTIAWKN